MRILVLGDIVGRPGRKFVSDHLKLSLKIKISLCIANGENAAGGAGITAKTAHELNSAGIDGITLATMFGIRRILKMKLENWTLFADQQIFRNQILAGII